MRTLRLIALFFFLATLAALCVSCSSVGQPDLAVRADAASTPSEPSEAPVAPMAAPGPGAPRYRIHALPFSSNPYAINDLGEIATTVPTGKRAKYSERSDDIPDDLALWENGKLRDLGNLPDNEMCWPVAINNRGEIVGQSGNYQQGPPEDYATNAFLWSHGHMRRIFEEADIDAMNDQGAIVGVDRSNNDAFVYAHAKERKVPDPGPFGSVHLTAINDKGEMVGWVLPPIPVQSHDLDPSHLPTYPYLWKGGKAIPLHLPSDWDRPAPQAINNEGQIVVVTTDKNHYIPLWGPGGNGEVEGLFPVYLWKAGKWSVIGPPPGKQEVDFVALNDRGEVIGDVDPSTGADNAPCLWKDGHTYSLYSLIVNNSGWVLESVSAINNKGEIVGLGYENGKQCAYLLTPEIGRK